MIPAILGRGAGLGALSPHHRRHRLLTRTVLSPPPRPGLPAMVVECAGTRAVLRGRPLPAWISPCVCGRGAVGAESVAVLEAAPRSGEGVGPRALMALPLPVEWLRRRRRRGCGARGAAVGARGKLLGADRRREWRLGGGGRRGHGEEGGLAWRRRDARHTATGARLGHFDPGTAAEKASFWTCLS